MSYEDTALPTELYEHVDMGWMPAPRQEKGEPSAEPASRWRPDLMAKSLAPDAFSSAEMAPGGAG